MKVQKVLGGLAIAGLLTARLATASTGAVAIESLTLVEESAPGAAVVAVSNHGGHHGGGHHGGHHGGYHGGHHHGGHHGGYYGSYYSYGYGGYYGSYGYGYWGAKKSSTSVELPAPKLGL